MAGEWGWRLHWQDYTHHRPGDPRPPACSLSFMTRPEAEAKRAELLRDENLIVCISPIPMPRAVKGSLARERNAASRLFVPDLPLQTRPTSA